jgi:predicted Na+-dependent transporter
VLAVAILFVMGGLLMMISEITGGERDWEIAIKGLASVFFIYPVILVLNSLAFSCTTIWIASLIVDCYVLFLLYNIGVYCLRGDKTKVSLVIAAFVIFMISVYATDYRTGWFMLKNTGATLKCLV